MADPRRRTRRRILGFGLLIGASIAGSLLAGATRAGSAPSTSTSTSTATAAARCPWVSQARAGQGTAASLAAEVLARMTLAQKASFVVLRTVPPLENTNLGIPALCIPPLTMTDGPNGIAYNMTGVTQLPAAIGVAATFDPSMAHATGTVMGQEARAKGIDAAQGPELNLARVPEAGRIFEAFGEDPVLTGAMGVAGVEGIQSTGTMANLKHVTAYSQETARHILDQQVTDRALTELFNPPYVAAVQQAHVASIMCSYGSVNGVNDCSDPTVYADLASWGFTGFVRSDLFAVPTQGTASAFRAGMDVDQARLAGRPGPAGPVRRHPGGRPEPVGHRHAHHHVPVPAHRRPGPGQAVGQRHHPGPHPGGDDHGRAVHGAPEGHRGGAAAGARHPVGRRHRRRGGPPDHLR